MRDAKPKWFLLLGLDALPWGELPAHPEILETRAMALWRFVAGQAQLMVVPVSAAMLHYHAAESYENLARTIERHTEVPLDDLVRHLESTGYIRAEMVEAPGQFAFRGGIVDVFPAEAVRPVRIELLGDTVESLREFDPDTQAIGESGDANYCRPGGIDGAGERGYCWRRRCDGKIATAVGNTNNF